MSNDRKRKARIATHVGEDTSTARFKALLPPEWVVRNYRPDYGLDLAVELFKPPDSAGKSETLGEHIFVQLKSVQEGDYTTHRVHSRYNIERFPEAESVEEDDFVDLDVIKFVIETPELNTVEAMGPGAPVLLVVVDLASNRAFLVCLNDYIDKCLYPRNPTFSEQGHCTIYIPVQNEITLDPGSLIPLRWYAKRSKLYAGFIKLVYQDREMAKYAAALSAGRNGVLVEVLRTTTWFAELSWRMDFWSAADFWEVLSIDQAELARANGRLAQELKANGETGTAFNIAFEILDTWRKLAVLPRIHEELCREWFLPTYLSCAM